MYKKLILPLASIISLIVFIALSCTPSVNGDPEDIFGSISYVPTITGAVESSISASLSNNIIPSAATVEYSIDSELPAGLTLVRNTGVIEGTPTEVSPSKSFVVTASGTGNYIGEIDSDPFSISIGPALSDQMDISSNSSIRYENITGTAGKRLASNPSTSIVPSTATVEYSISPELPAGLNFDSEMGKIDGTPEAESAETDNTNYRVTVTATGDFTESVESNSFTIVIVDEKSISGSTLNYSDITGTTGKDLLIAPTSTIPEDAAATYTVDPAFPTGLTLSEDGNITVAREDAFVLTTLFRVTAMATAPYTGMVTSNEFTIAVKIPITAGSVTYEAIERPAGSQFSVVPSTNFVPDTATVEYSIDPELPEGLMLKPETGEIHGTPEAESAPTDNTDYVVTASGTGNYTGEIKSDSFTIKVIEATKPFIEGTLTYANSSININESMTIRPTTNTLSTDSVTYSLVLPETLPGNVMINSGTGAISVAFGTTDQAFASTTFQVTATATEASDYAGFVQSNPFTIEARIPITGGTLSYDDFSGVLGISTTDVSLAPMTNNIPAEAVSSFTYAYVVTSTSGSLPSELTFDPNNGTISGILTPVNVTLEVTATASGIYEGTAVSNEFNIVITKQLMGRISYGGPHTFFEGIIVNIFPTFDITPAAARSSLTYAVTSGDSLPNTLEVYPSGGINGTAYEIGVHTIRITATANGIYGGSVTSDEFTITVRSESEKTSISGGGASMTYGSNNEISFNTGTGEFEPMLTGTNFIAAQDARALSFKFLETVIYNGQEFTTEVDNIEGNKVRIANDGTISLGPNVMTTSSANPTFTTYTIRATGTLSYKGTVTQRIRLENLNLQ